MRLTFRAKLVLIVAAALISGLSATVASALLGLQQNRDLADVENRLVPRLELGPRATAEFTQLRRSLQDAVAAEDANLLSDSAVIRKTLLARIDSAGQALAHADARALREAIDGYFTIGRDVSQRLIAGETGEAVVNDMATMQARQARVESLLKSSLELDQAELETAFAAIRGANERADRLRLFIGFSGMLLVLGLSYWLGRGVLGSLRHLSLGFARFATGDFDRPIPTKATRDLAGLTQAANRMARSLKNLAAERDRDAWLKAGQAGLSNELRGELSPTDVGHRALRFLSQRLHAAAGVVYLRDATGILEVLVDLGRSGTANGDDHSKLRIAPGEGLVGQAALADDVVVVDHVPPDYFKLSSGLGEAVPGTLVFMPLAHRDKTVGVVEFALFGSCSERTVELLRSTRESLSMAFEATKSRAELERLLTESRRQAERLAAQEEELRMSNGELQAQQEELRLANEELETQRRTLHDNNARLEEAGRRLQEKAEELARVSSYKSQFLANMSHELRTPLNSMLLLAHLLGENEGGRLSPKQLEHCKTIYSAGEDLLDLINQILDLAKIEAGRQDVTWQKVPTDHFSAFVKRRFADIATEKGLELVTDVAADVPAELVTDVQRLERILTNLVGNAIKFTERGTVAFRISRTTPGTSLQRRDLQPERTLAFAVSDTGVGIKGDLHDTVFRPFEQAEGAPDRSFGGTGLGLAIVRESIALLGGEVQLQSEPGQGSTFTCYVPLRAEESRETDERAPEPERVTPYANGTPSASTEAKLLLIEDDAVLSEQLTEIIRARRLGSLTARSGHEGLRLAREPGVVGIILDVRLPDMDGWQVIELLRRDPRTHGIPVHFITAIDTPERGLALGAVGYLVKPVTHADLTNAVFTLTRAAGSKPRLLVVEDNVTEGQSIVELLRTEDVDATHVLNAQAALTALESQTYGCIILDLSLPDMDGLSLLEAVKTRVGAGAPRVVVHTGRALTKHETRQLETYAEAVILKDQRSAERLREEVRCFIKHLKEGLAKSQPTTIVRPDVRSDISLADVKLLLAEDDMRTVYALSALLLGKGAEVLIAENGKQALDLLQAHPNIQAVLMDIMMPEMDGYEAMRALRQIPRFAELPVIALTARAMKGERERCLDAGANDYLAKPVDTELLLRTLARWLRKGSPLDAN